MPMIILLSLILAVPTHGPKFAGNWPGDFSKAVARAKPRNLVRPATNPPAKPLPKGNPKTSGAAGGLQHQSYNLADQRAALVRIPPGVPLPIGSPKTSGPAGGLQHDGHDSTGSRGFSVVVPASSWLMLRVRAENLIDKGEWSKVPALLEPRMKAYPDDYWTAVPLADYYFHANRPQDALRMLQAVGDSVKSDMMSQEYWLRASLASALCGIVYKGQYEYVVNAVTVRKGLTEKDRKLFPTGTDAKSISVMSALAIGNLESSHSRDKLAAAYGEMVLSMDPGNPVATYLYLPTLHGRPDEWKLRSAAVKRAIPRMLAAGDADSVEYERRLCEVHGAGWPANYKGDSRPAKR